MSTEKTRDSTPIVRKVGDGIRVGGSAGTPTVVKLSGSDAREAYSLLEMEVPPGNGNRTHVHHESEEAFYVLEGELTIRMGDQDVRAPLGTLILIPRGTPHSFANESDHPGKALFIFSPPGMENWFVEMTRRREESPRRSLEWETIRALALKYGTEFVE